MSCYSRGFLALLLTCLAMYSVASAADLNPHRAQPVPPGALCDETVFKEVVKHTCKYVTELKKVKKTVYECKEVPYCLPKCQHCLLFGHKPGCGDCGPCEPVRTKKVLVKREIEITIPVRKCVVESCVEKVPVKMVRPVTTHLPIMPR